MLYGAVACGQPEAPLKSNSRERKKEHKQKTQDTDLYKKRLENPKISDFFEIRSWQIEKSFVKEALHTLLSPVESE